MSALTGLHNAITGIINALEADRVAPMGPNNGPLAGQERADTIAAGRVLIATFRTLNTDEDEAEANRLAERLHRAS